MPLPRCDTCMKLSSTHTVGVPGMARTARLCLLCRAHHAYPMGALVEYAADQCGTHDLEAWVWDSVHATTERLGISCGDFQEMVNDVLAQRASQ